MFSTQKSRTVNQPQQHVMHMHIRNVKPDMRLQNQFQDHRLRAPTPQEQKSATDIEENRRRMQWGHHIWIFLHTLSVQIREDAFPVVGQELLRHIHGIVTNLPCPICSDHAKDYMKNINLAAIQTKEQLINLLFHFHNSVNQRKGYALFNRQDVESTYSRAIMNNAYHNFEMAYKDKSFNPKHITDEYVRNRVLMQFRGWLRNNGNNFL